VSTASLEDVLTRDRAIVAGALVAITVTAWAYMFYDARRMAVGVTMPQMQFWSLGELSLVYVMWAVMMVGMMVPSASPTVLLFARVNRMRHQEQHPFAPTWLFLLGYLAAWSGFSLAATLAQWELHSAALLSPMMVATSPLLAGGLLLAAGLFQWTPLKNACLVHCRSPHQFLASHWREGRLGAFVIGLHHGLYCIGCCWILMGLLFVLGVMNLLWIAVLTGFVLLEKIAPPAAAPWTTRIVGLVLALWGGSMLAGLGAG
jgi:predicted metal-binding membrane protein